MSIHIALLSSHTKLSVYSAIVLWLCINVLSAWGVPASPAGGNYLKLDGIDDYAILDFNTFGMLFEEGTSELTVEAWVYPTSAPQEDERFIILMQQVTFAIYNDPELREKMGWHESDLSLAMQILQAEGISTPFRAMAISPYQWHHIAIQSGNGHEAWICDSLCLSKQGGIASIENDLTWFVDKKAIPHQGFVVGGYGEEYPASFSGYIDEVRISTAPRYDVTNPVPIPQGKFEPDTDTIALWHFDEPIGSRIFYDSSGSKYHLFAVNGASLAVKAGNKLAGLWAEIKISGN